MKNDMDVQELLRKKKQRDLLQKQEEQFDTGFRDAHKNAQEVSLDQSSELLEQEKDLSGGIQEVRQEDGVRQLKGEIPAGPKYIGFDSKFTVIEKEDSERMRAVKDALRVYHDNNREISDLMALERLIDACNAYCKGRFAFFKAFRKAGVRLAEVKALRAEATEMKNKYEEFQEKNILIYGEEEESSRRISHTSLKTKLKSKTYRDEEELLKRDAQALKEGTLDDDFDEDEYLDDAYDCEAEVKDLKQQLIDEYRKMIPDSDNLEDLERKLWNRTEDMLKYNTYLKEHYPDSVYMDGQEELDLTLAKLRIPYQDKVSKEKIQKEASTEEFKEELRDMAMENYSGDYHMDDADLMQRDKAYSEKELKNLLKEFESFDFSQISFSNPLDIIRNFRQNAVFFEHVRSVHYQVFRGIHHGFSMDDEQMIKLRAKFMAAFEMQDYMIKLNGLAAEGKLDLTQSEEGIKNQVLGNMEKDHFNRLLPDFGDPNVFLARCEEKLRKEYEHKEEFIEKIIHVTEYAGDEETSVPDSKIRKRAKGYEKNALISDYFHRRLVRAKQHSQDKLRMKYYNETHEEELKPVDSEIGRMHFNFLYGKSNEDRVRLTNLQGGTAEERLEYYKEVIRALKSFDLKELDARNLTTFYENFERKEVVMQLYTNSSSIANKVVAILKELRKEEIQKNPDADPGELQLPEDFKKEFGYKDLDEFVKDMYVSNNIGNTIQTKMDRIGEIADFGFFGAFSLKEIFTMDGKKLQTMVDNVDTYRQKYEEEHGEEFVPEKGTVDDFLDTAISQFYQTNLPIDTRPITKEEKRAGKQQQRMTMDVSIFDILEEEREAYDKKVLKEREEETRQANEMSDKIDKLYRAKDELPKQLGLGAGDTIQRMLKGYAGPMAYFCKDTEEKSKERMKALLPEPEKATHEEKEAMARELEDGFRQIVEFDLGELNVTDYSDVLKSSYTNAALMSKFCFEFNALFDKYEVLIKDETVDTKLELEDFQEIKAKKDFLQTYQSMFETIYFCYKNSAHVKYDLNKILQWNYEQLCEVLEHGEDYEGDLYTLVTNASVVYESRKQLGFGPGVDVKQLYDKTRAKYGAPKEDRRESVKKKLERNEEKK